MHFSTQKEHEKAGLIVFQNENHYYYLCKSYKNGDPVLQLLKSDDKTQVEISSRVLENDHPVFLKVEADHSVYNFYYSFDGDVWEILASDIEATFLSTEVAGGFVGAFYGMYTTSSGEKSENSAAIHWFKNINKDENKHTNNN